jgi:hypothetical protein
MTTPAPTLDPTEVQVGTANGPGIWLAPSGTQLPADTFTAFATPWMILGYLSDDGPTVGQNTDKTDITPWQSVVPLRSVITSRQVTLQFIMWQLNQITLGVYFDADPPTPDPDTGAIDMEIRSDTPQHLYSVAVDSRDADQVLRVGFTRASLSDAGDMQIQRGAAVPLDVTLTALDDAGVLAHVMLGPATDPGVTGLAQPTTDTVLRVNSGKGA